MNKVLDSAKFVVDNSNYVKIDKSKINEFCKNFSKSHINHWINQAPFDFRKLDDEKKLNFLLAFNSISFSYWGQPKWTVQYNGERFDGAFGMIAAFGRAIENNIPVLDMRYLSKIDEKDLYNILNANVMIPLFKERLKILREIGTVVIERFDGNFRNLIKEANGDAIKLVDLIVSNFSNFDDKFIYKGKTVFFYKRAQLLVSDIYQIFKGNNYGRFNNVNQLTACADYKLPMVLRRLGILMYSKELSEQIDKRLQIIAGLGKEVEIRANTIWAVELIRQKLKGRIPSINAIHINDYLWLLGQVKLPNDKPYHLTRTINY